MALPDLQTTDWNGIALAWREAGDGAPLVFLHGIGAGSIAWEAQIAHFSRQYRTIAWDAPGYGGSGDFAMDAPEPGDFGDALAGLFDKIGVDAAHLCGNSLGALMIAGFVRRHPDRVLSMVLSDAAAGHARVPAAKRDESLNARIDAVQTLGPAGMAEQRARRIVAKGATEEAVAKVRAVMARVRPDGYCRAARMLAYGDIFKELEGCDKPAMVICGAEDIVTPPDINRQVAAALKDCPFALLDGVGHLPYVEAPDRFNRLVEDFLAGQARAAA